MRSRLLILSLALFVGALSAAPTVQETLGGAERAARFLSLMVDDDGRFLYRFNFEPTIEVQPKYNLLRHAGSIYSLADAIAERGNEDVLDASKRASLFLKKTIEPIEKEEDILLVISRPELNGTGNPPVAKLGGAGLALVALVSLERVEPGFTDQEMLRDLARGILFMQKPDGSFHSKYDLASGTFDEDWHSLYYPGEAALGLAMLYQIDRNEAWLEGAVDTLLYLARSREGEVLVPADHWALIATSEVFSIADRSGVELPREALEAHALQVVNSMLQSQITPEFSDTLHGAFNRDGRITPTATRLEGLIATLSWLPADHPRHAEVREAVDAGVAFLLRVQLENGAFTRSVDYLPREFPRAALLNQRAMEVRIDYVQHALSALIGYARLGGSAGFSN